MTMTGPLPMLSPNQAHEWLNQHEAILIDVRTLNAYKALHIPHSFHVPDPEQIYTVLAEHPTERVILVCQNGNQAAEISRILLQKNAETDMTLFYILDGGLNGWRNAGLPILRDTGNGMAIDRQVHIAQGLILLVSVLFSLLFNGLWLVFPVAIGIGLICNGLTGWYGFNQLILLMPWNRYS